MQTPVSGGKTIKDIEKSKFRWEKTQKKTQSFTADEIKNQQQYEEDIEQTYDQYDAMRGMFEDSAEEMGQAVDQTALLKKEFQ